jgi:hypothetical protein
VRGIFIRYFVKKELVCEKLLIENPNLLLTLRKIGDRPVEINDGEKNVGTNIFSSTRTKISFHSILPG